MVHFPYPQKNRTATEKLQSAYKGGLDKKYVHQKYVIFLDIQESKPNTAISLCVSCSVSSKDVSSGISVTVSGCISLSGSVWDSDWVSSCTSTDGAVALSSAPVIQALRQRALPTRSNTDSDLRA